MAAPDTTTSDLSSLVTAAYDRHTELARRSSPQFRSIGMRKAVAQTHPGSSVTFEIHPNMAQATSTLNEASDPTGVSLVDTTATTVTLAEYGNWTKITNRLQKFNYDNMFDSNVANIIAYNQLDSIDKVVQNVLATGTNVVTEESGTLVESDTGTPTVGNVTATDKLASDHIAFTTAALRADSVPTFDGANYVGFVHPYVAHDLRRESGSLGWRVPHEYVDTASIYAGEVGTYEGVRFIESPRCQVTADGGSTTTDLYFSYVLGQGALAEAVAEEFHTVISGTVVDALDRYTPIGWYGIAGWALHRAESLWVIKTASSLGDN